jgi:hypothetical protein
MAYGKASLAILIALAALSSCSEKMTPSLSGGNYSTTTSTASQPSTSTGTQSQVTIKGAEQVGTLSARPMSTPAVK